jgi:hypothetical protein
MEGKQSGLLNQEQATILNELAFDDAVELCVGKI